MKIRFFVLHAALVCVQRECTSFNHVLQILVEVPQVFAALYDMLWRFELERPVLEHQTLHLSGSARF